MDLAAGRHIGACQEGKGRNCREGGERVQGDW
jgi:hypothetical protein